MICKATVPLPALQTIAMPLQKALQIGLQQPRMAEVALVALESCPQEIAVTLAPLIGPSIGPYLVPVSTRRFDEQVQPGASSVCS